MPFLGDESVDCKDPWDVPYSFVRRVFRPSLDDLVDPDPLAVLLFNLLNRNPLVVAHVDRRRE